MKDFDTERRERRARVRRGWATASSSSEARRSPTRDVGQLHRAGADRGPRPNDDGADLIRRLRDEPSSSCSRRDRRSSVLAVLHSTDRPIHVRGPQRAGLVADGGQSGRPTLASSPSTAGDAETETSSTDRLLLQTGRGVSGLSLREFINLIYAMLAEGRNEQGDARARPALAPTPEAAQEIIDKANMEAMRRLSEMMGARQVVLGRRTMGAAS